jgi:KRAB domain-containing zinc finger protein
MWTAHKRSYLGMTAHWKGEDLKRSSACLAVRRVKGRHTFDVIASTINEIHKEFKIQGKVNVMITDSGLNFLKAFKIFGKNELTEDQENLQYEEDEETKITRRTQMALSIWI